MASVFVDIPGIGPVEAKNAATESTLRELVNAIKGLKGKDAGGQTGDKDDKKDAKSLKEFNDQVKNANKNQKDLNKEKKDGIKGMKELTNAGRAAGNALEQMGRASLLAGRAADVLGAKIGQAANSLTGMIDSLANVGDSLTQAAGTMRHIPVVGGILSGVFNAVAGAADKTVGAYQNAASVGATFGGSIQDMSRAASSAGMTLEKFAQMIQSNGEGLMLLGGTTEQGAKRFSQLSKSMQASGLTSELNRMGYSTAQVNDGILKYATLMGRTGALQRMSTDQIAKGSAGYLKELDALAKITGQTREAKQQEMDALMAEGKVRAALAGIEDPEQQKKMLAYITSFPKEAQGAIADMISTGSITSEEAVKFAALMPGAAEQAMSFGRTLQSGGKISDQAMNQARNRAIMEARESQKRNKQLGQFAEEYGRTYVGVSNLAAQEINGYSKAIGEQAKSAENAKLAEELEAAKRKLAQFSNAFTLFLANSGMLDALMTAFEALASFVQAVALPAFTLITAVLNALIPIVKDTIIPAFTILGTWIKDAVVPIFQRAVEIVSNVVSGLFDFFGISTAATDGLGVFEEILYAVSNFVEDNLTVVLGALGFMIASSVIPKMVAMIAPMVSLATTVGSVVFNLAKFAAQLVISTFKFVAMNLPLIKIAAVIGLVTLAFKGVQWIMSKFGLEFSMLGDLFKYVGTMFSDMWLKMKYGIFSLLNKIPGMRGDFNDDLKNISEEMKANEDKRKQIEEDLKTKKEKNLENERNLEKQKIDQEKAEQAEAASKEQKREEAKAARQKRREDDAAKREKDRHDRQMAGIKKEEEAREASASETDAPTNLNDPISMLKSFAEKQKSAFSQEAKALDQKDQARKELAMASDQYTNAMKKAANAKTKEEKELAEKEVAAAEARMKDAAKAQEDADKKVTEAAARMKLAKEGKDPGPKREEKPRAQGKPADSDRAPGAGTGMAGGKMPEGLGGMAAKFESGKAGSQAVGWDSTGGTSFGKYQIAAKTGTMDKFMDHLKKTNPEAFERLSKAGPADTGKDGKFAQEWKKLASEGKLQQSEHEFIKKTHYDVGAKGLKDKNLQDMLGKSKALQEVMWSTSVQHGGGGASGIFNKVYKEGMSEQDLIKAIYAERGTRFGSSTAQVRSSVQDRFAKEQQLALGLVGQPGEAGTTQLAQAKPVRGDQTTPSPTQVAQATAKEEKTSKPTSSEMATGSGAIGKPPGMPGMPGQTQESAETLLAQLNMKMDALIQVSKNSVDINNKQLSVQQNMTGNLYA